MLSDKDIDNLIKPIIELYNEIEVGLIMEIASRFSTYDELAGSLEWQVKKLNEMGGLNQKVLKIIAKYSGRTEQEIKDMLTNAGYNSVPIDEFKRIFEAGAFIMDPTNVSIVNVIENSYKELNNTFRLIQTKAVQAAKQSYMNIVNKAYLEVATGIYDYNTSIKKATEEMVNKGFNYATYVTEDGTVRRTSIEAAVRREVLSAVNKVANESNEQFIKELGAEHVETTWHFGARNKGDGFENHELWQGKVYKINGSEPGYPNFVKSTGYGDILGLGGVNCRHSHHAFFPGYSIPNTVPDDYDHELYDKLQEQRYNERMIRYWKKRRAAAEGIGDEEAYKKADAKVTEWSYKNQALVDSNDNLRRDFNRERVYSTDISKLDDESQYNLFKNTLGPKYSQNSLDNFKEIKYNDVDKFKDLKEFYHYKSLNENATYNDFLLNKIKKYSSGTPTVAEKVRAYLLKDERAKKDQNHIFERMIERNVTSDELHDCINGAKVMFEQWKGTRRLYITDKIAVVIVKRDEEWIYKTCMKYTDYGDKYMAMLEVLKKWE